MYESTSEIDKIGVAFGTYCSPDGLIATIQDLLSDEFSLQDLCVVGPVRLLSQALTLLDKELQLDVGQASLFARTESFFGDDDLASGVGSKGRLLSILKGLMERRRICADDLNFMEYRLDSLELKKQIDKGNVTLFVCTSAPDLLVPALRILMKRSSFKVQSHEFRR